MPRYRLRTLLINALVVVGTAGFCGELFAEAWGRTLSHVIPGLAIGAFAATMGLIAWHLDLKQDRTD